MKSGWLFLGRTVMTNKDSVCKSWDITLPTKVHIVKAMVFTVVMWELDCKEGKMPKNWCFQTVVLEKTLESPLTARRSNQSILKEINPEYLLEGLMLKLKLKLRYSGHLMRRTDSLEKTVMLGKIEGRRRSGWQRMRYWMTSQLNGHEFEQDPGVGDGQGSLSCCSPLGHKELDTTERLNWTGHNACPVQTGLSN